MAWRRAIGTLVMMLGAAGLLGTVAGATVLSVSYVKSVELVAPVTVLAGVLAGAVVAGIAIMLAGRAIYGRWNDAAPIANFTGDITRMVGLSIAIGLGAMLVFLFVTGMKPEDGLAALVLGIGALSGLGLAYIGANLRRSGRRYLD